MSCFKILVMNKIISYIMFFTLLKPTIEQFQYLGAKKPYIFGKEEWRSIVVIEFDSMHVCSGSLIEKEFVLTAAHCVDRTFSNNAPFKNSTLSCRIGGSFNEIEDDVIPVECVYFHPDYNLTAGIADIALLKLKFSVRPNIRIINLPTAQLTYGSHCHLIGWKDLEYDQNISKRIAPIVPLPKRTIYISEQALMDQSACEEALHEINLEIYKEEMPEKTNLISPTSICTKWKSNDVKLYDNYTDSGGPILCDKELHGVHSFQLEMKDNRIFYISTRVDKYISWINNVTINAKKSWVNYGLPQILTEEDLKERSRKYQAEPAEGTELHERFDDAKFKIVPVSNAETLIIQFGLIFVLCGLHFCQQCHLNKFNYL